MNNILIIMPNIENGGIEKNLILLSSYLSNKSNITVVCSEISENIKKSLDGKIKLFIAKQYFKTSYIPKRILNTVNAFFGVILNRKKIVNNETIILSLQNHPFPIILSKILNKKIIIRIANHPYTSLKYFNSKISFLIKIFIKIFFYKLADGIICNSDSSRDYLKKYIKRKSIVTILNPINLKREFSFNRKRKNLVSVGRLENQKNMGGIILALKKVINYFPSIKLIIIGSGSEKKKLEKLVNDNNLKEHVIFKGYVNPLDDLLSCKILILNSFFEGLPNILIEGLSCKIPIISTNCESGPKEILENEKYGSLVEVNNHEELSNKILDVLNNYDEAIIKAENGFKSLDRFEYSNQLRKVEDYIFSFKN